MKRELLAYVLIYLLSAGAARGQNAGETAAPIKAQIVNPGFEEPLSIGWTYYQGKYGRAFQDAVEPHSGQYSLCVEKTSDTGYQQLYSVKPTVAGAEYIAAADEEWRLTYWVRTEGAARFYCLARFRPNTFSDQYDKPINWWTLGGTIPQAKPPWVKREMLIDVPRGAGFMCVQFSLSGKAGSKTWVDDISLEKVGNTPAAVKPESPRKLKRLVYLSHPYCYEFGFQNDPDSALAGPACGGYSPAQILGMERQVSARWAEEVKKLGPDDALVINEMSMGPAIMSIEGVLAPVWKAAREHMPGRYLVTFGLPREADGRNIREKFLEKGYTYDSDALAAEAWGQSTEGCVPNYAGHRAAGLGLTKGFVMDWNLTFPDAPFMMTGKFLERVPVDNSDISLYLLETADGRPLGIYFPGVVHDAQPARYVRFAAGPGQVEFTNKRGDRRQIADSNGTYRIPVLVDGQGEPLYIWGKSLDRAGLKTALAAATTGWQDWYEAGSLWLRFPLDVSKVAAEEKWKASLRIKNAGPLSSSVLGVYGPGIYAQGKYQKPGADEWSTTTCEFTVKPGLKDVTLDLWILGGRPDTRVWVDDVRLESPAGPVAALANGDFETGPGEQGVIPGFRQDNGGGQGPSAIPAVDMSLDATVSASAKQSLLIIFKKNKPAWLK